MTSVGELIILLESWLEEIRVIRSKRVPAGVRRKRKQYYRRRKARIKRMARTRRRKPRAKRLAKRRKAIRKRLHLRPGSRRRVRLASAGMMANLMEGLKVIETKDLIRGFENAVKLSDQLIAVLGNKLEESKKEKPDHHSPNDFKWDLPSLTESNHGLDPDFEALLGVKKKVEERPAAYSDFDKVKADATYMIEQIKGGKADLVECEQILGMIVESLDKSVEKVMSDVNEEESREQKFQIGDHVARDDDSDSGVVTFVGQYDEHLDDIRYKVKQKDGTVKHWNGKSMKLAKGVSESMNEDERAKPVEHTVELKLNLGEVAEALKYKDWTKTNDHLDADYDDVYHDGYTPQQAKQMSVKGMDDVEKIFPDAVGAAAENAERDGYMAAIRQARVDAIVEALELIQVVGEYQSTDGDMVSMPAGIESASVDGNEVTLKVKNPEHLINDLVNGVGMFSPDFDSYAEASEAEIKSGLLSTLGDYFDVYGDRKPSGDLDDRFTPDVDDDFFKEEVKHYISEMSIDQVVDAVVDAVDQEEFENENKAIAIAAKYSEFSKQEIAKAVKAKLSGHAEKMSSRAASTAEESKTEEAVTEKGETQKYAVYDWAGNYAFQKGGYVGSGHLHAPEHQFDSFEDAEEFLDQMIAKHHKGEDYDEVRGEYEILPVPVIGEGQSHVKAGVKYLLGLAKEAGDDWQEAIDTDEVNDYMKEVLGMSNDDIAAAYEQVGNAMKESLDEAKGKWIIIDWAGNVKFDGKEFDSFEDGEEFLSHHLGDNYETDRGEFEVVQGKTRDSKYLDPKDPRAGKVVDEAGEAPTSPKFKGKQMTPQKKKEMGMSLPGKFVRSGDTDSAKKIMKSPTRFESIMDQLESMEKVLTESQQKQIQAEGELDALKKMGLPMGQRYPGAKKKLSPEDEAKLHALYRQRDAMGVQNGSDEYNQLLDKIDALLGEDKGEAPPKDWYEKVVRQLKAQDPKYTDDLVKSHVDKIWKHHFSDEKRKAILAKENTKHAMRTGTSTPAEKAAESTDESLDEAKKKKPIEKVIKGPIQTKKYLKLKLGEPYSDQSELYIDEDGSFEAMLSFDTDAMFDQHMTVDEELTKQCQDAFNEKYDGGGWATWREEWIKSIGGDVGYIGSGNTYNNDSAYFWADDVFEFTDIKLPDGKEGAIIMKHLGGDVRGNYADPVVYVGDFESVYSSLDVGDPAEEIAYALGYQGDKDQLAADIKELASKGGKEQLTAAKDNADLNKAGADQGGGDVQYPAGQQRAILNQAKDLKVDLPGGREQATMKFADALLKKFKDKVALEDDGYIWVFDKSILKAVQQFVSDYFSKGEEISIWPDGEQRAMNGAKTEEDEVKLHSTYQPDTYYLRFDQLPKAAQEILKNTEVEVENSSYTVHESYAYLRNKVEVNGKLWDAEVSLGSVDIQHAGYEWNEEEDTYVDDEGRPIDSDEHAEQMAKDLMGVIELENTDVYLSNPEELDDEEEVEETEESVEEGEQTEGFKSSINEKTASSTIKKYEALKNKKQWDKQEILGVAHQLSGLDRGWKKDTMDEELKYILHELLASFSEGKTVDISPDQSKQGIDWLRKNIINAKGELRDNGMVRDAGFDESHGDIIKNFKKFELVGFHHDEQHHTYSPIYRTISADGNSFDYSVSGGFGGVTISIH